ncbi:alpha-1,2-fucosyltransferase [Pedobacter sp. MW01-1-1]|uniref:alpha-1,2-fucosyltransferase n=1 Tax=Pedobacter sp. MW01-1-1 TaxID=3383027 RepID=UPI003FED7BCC
MIGVTIQCRLGNQLFQYAFVRALSKKLDTPFFVNEKQEKFLLTNYFTLKGYHPSLNSIKRIVLKIQKKSLFSPLQNKEYTSDSLRKNEIYEGFFQSEHYFTEIKNDIHSYIQIKKTHQQAFNKRYGDYFAKHKIIAIHIRRSDYLNLGYWWYENLGSTDLSLPTTYYRNCLNQIDQLSTYKILFISDDIEFTRNEFSDVQNAEFVHNDMIIDFQIMMNASICIVSNSSFAWWAAYLNPNKNKEIYCPEFWLGFKIKKEYPENIIPASWIKVSTEC